MGESRIRVRREDRWRLKQLKDHPEMIEKAGENPSYDDMLEVILPEPTEDNIVARPEEDMVPLSVSRMHEKTKELAGENVSAHEVIRYYIDDFIETDD